MSSPCHLLLVEPDLFLAEAARKLFAAYEVIVWTAADATTAMDFVTHVHFDCVLIDVAVWSGADGVELARRIRRQHPTVRLALSTGLNADEVDAPPGVPVFQKPYRFDAVVASFCRGSSADN